MKKYPFFLVIDDGAQPTVESEGRIHDVGIAPYQTVLRIADRFGLRIPICFTMKYLDTKNISGCASPLKYTDELIGLLKGNRSRIEVGYHGLTHQYQNHAGEFYCLDSGSPVPGAVQQEHIDKSAEIFSAMGFDFPEIFVPPYHAWERGVTDNLVSKLGVKYLVSFSRLEYKGRAYTWDRSNSVLFLDRDDIGIYSHHITLDEPHLMLAQKLVLPRSIINNLRFRRRLINRKVHSYMVHVGNFAPQNYLFWVRLLEWVQHNPVLELCENNQRAVDLFLGD